MNDLRGQVIAKILVLEGVVRRVTDSLEERVINEIREGMREQRASEERMMEWIQESVQNREHEINTAYQAFQRSITHHVTTALEEIQHMNTALVGIEQGVREGTANQRALN